MTASSPRTAELDRKSLNGAEHPVVPGFYPDPTICRVGADYYMAHSSFEYFPGAPLWHSRDLISWTQVGHVLTRRSQFRRGTPLPSTGVFGSTLRHHGGRFWFVTTNASDYDAGQVLVHAEDATAPWSEPVFVAGAVGIDPDLCWTDDGTCYLTWKEMDFLVERIRLLQAPLDTATGGLLADPYPVWQGTGMAGAEAPHLHRVGDLWYLFLAEGGTERGHCVTVARGPRPWGPFEPCPSNPILTHRSSAHPVQNTGHADLVQTPSGDWAAVYLGVRARGSAPLFHVLGRETFLAGVNWIDGWPVIDESRYEVPQAATDFDDDFSADRLDLRWVVPGGEPDGVVDLSGVGVLVHPATPDQPGLLCTRVRDLAWTAEAVVEGSGRLLLMMDDRHWYGLTLHDGVVTATTCVGGQQQESAPVAVSAAGSVVLRIQATPPDCLPIPLGHAGPDDIVLSLLTEHGPQQLARLDGRYLSTEVVGGWTGRMLALGATNTPARVLSIRYRADG